MTLKNKKVKAWALLSGGLDSRLAIKMMQEQQGIEVIAVYFSLPFGTGCCMPSCAFNFAQTNGIKLKIIDCTKGTLFQEYISIVRNPKHGHGSAINPCIDCRIFMLKKSKELMKKLKADFVVTGEVLNERPMSQTRNNLDLIEKEATLTGYILRPLSAKLLEETIPEKKGLVDRNKLLSINGRSRKIQMELALKYDISYPSPAGGCILCEKNYEEKLRDLFETKKKIEPRDIELSRIGRHFRIGKTKIIIGRNSKENSMISALSGKNFLFEVPDCGSPTTILESEKSKPTKKEIEIAAKFTAYYSKNTEKNIAVDYWKEEKNKEKISVKLDDQEMEDLLKNKIG